ncbi:SPO75 [Candida margitis]|uniref:SPO75 n=1 Tax=Candida margitis TaxID=1775924 RepID=UPI002227FAC8|nr:SPO75 [Candida margitis]KAI5966126.1 SPO75 [Candida margitis]
MSSIDIQQNDYKTLTQTYMEFFNSKQFANFLNTTQTGSAHSSSGIDFSVFIKTLFTSICFCTIQLTLFCLIRSVFNSLYQPRCFCVPVNERMEVLPRGFMKWVVPTLKSSINTYLSLGLDAYFFIRFISVLSLFFLFVGSLNMIILIPINFTSGDAKYTASGLDKLSLSNISSSNVTRLNAHFIMGLFTIALFHWLIIYEFQSFVTIRQSYLLSESHRNSIMARTLLIFNVPPYLQDKGILKDLFQHVPGGVRNIWHLYNFETIDHQVRKARDALMYLEMSQMLTMTKYYRLTWLKSNIDAAKFLSQTDIKFYPPVYCNLITIHQIDRCIRFKFPGWIRVFALQKRVSMLTWSLETLTECQAIIDEENSKLVNNDLTKHNKVFVEFEDQRGACIAHQALLSQSQGCLDKTLIEVHPDDVIWGNISRTDGIACKFEKYLVTLIFITVVILYVVPVSLIGLVSQIPTLTKLMPCLNWVYQLPEEARETISGFLPSILLTVLTEIVMMLFRFLSYFKGKATGSEIEMDLQRWYFAFLFVQQFLVVTISSSVTVICRQIIDQPTSIPVLLATNLPKSATFFFQYICLRAFALCGNSFLRIKQLMLTNTWYKWIDVTPRQKFTRITTLPEIKWGTTFAVYSIYACIGISYSIISPLISIFIIFFLNLSILYFKYALKYVFSHINRSETMGRLYPSALLHLYVGIYCLECCLIGVFFVSKDSRGSYPMKYQGLAMTWVLFFTVFANTLIYNRYIPYFSNLPILSDKIYKDDQKGKDSATSTRIDTNHDMLYLHPAFKYEPPKIWLPKDPDSFSDLQLEQIQSRMTTTLEGQTEGAYTSLGRLLSLKVVVSDAPPDYK